MPSTKGDVHVRRIHDDVEVGGARVLVDRLWPRGVSKEDADLTARPKEVAPSDDLRQWYDHDPDRFDAGRDPNPHLAFGVGEHYCLGTHVARLELRALFRQLIPRLAAIELTEPPARLAHAIVGGIKRMNVRYELDRSAA